MPPLTPDVAIVHAQRADAAGDTQMLGPARRPEGGRLRGRPRHRRRRGARRRGGHPGRPQPHGHPRTHRGRRGRGALRRPSLLRAGRLRPRQPLLRGVGHHQPGRRPTGAPGWTTWVHALPGGPSTWSAWGGSVLARIRPTGPALAGPVDYGAVPVSTPQHAATATAEAGDGWSASEMMIVAAARELAGQRVCFVGIGLPNIAVNLALRTVAPDLELVYEAGAYGAQPARLPLSIGDPTIVTGALAVDVDGRPLRLLPPGRTRRRGLPGRRPDRPLRQHQHDGHRRLPRPAHAPAGLGRRLRDRPQRPPGLRGHAPVVAARSSSASTSAPRRETWPASGASRTPRLRAGWPVGDRRSSSPTSASTTSTRAARCGSIRLHPGATIDGCARLDGLAGAPLAPTSPRPQRPPPRSSTSSARCSTLRATTPS